MQTFTVLLLTYIYLHDQRFRIIWFQFWMQFLHFMTDWFFFEVTSFEVMHLVKKVIHTILIETNKLPAKICIYSFGRSSILTFWIKKQKHMIIMSFRIQIINHNRNQCMENYLIRLLHRFALVCSSLRNIKIWIS